MAFLTAVTNGTSPRMRGKPATLLLSQVDLRNIPAYAGKTPHYWGIGYPTAEHPRVCGENTGTSGCLSNHFGTSPRMRGKPRGPAKHYQQRRNIPAYAGKTKSCDSPIVHTQEHPRVCGENVSTRVSGKNRRGTSPRMRGKLRGFRS